MKDGATPFALFAREFGENRIAVAALALVVIIVALAVLAPLVAPQNPYDLATLTLRDARRPPGFVGAAGYAHWLGTDAQGRDMFSAILFGLRISLQISVTAGLIALTLGATLGAAAAFLGGRTEALIMRIIDLQLSFPAILLALVLAAILGQGKTQLTIALIAAQYAYFARTAHGAAVTERGKEYIEAALSVPLPGHIVVFRHILPNCLPPLIVVATVQIANGFQYMLSGRYWISIYPGIALVALIVAVNLVGDQIRDQFNPRLKR